MINSRNIDDLDAPTQTACRGLKAEAEARFDIELRITSTYRDFEEQARYYEIGRTVIGANPTAKRPMGETVTGAEAGESWHNWRCAFDVVPMRAGETMYEDLTLWDDIGALATKYGLEWGGLWPDKKRDRPHFQLRQGRTIAQMLAAHPHGLGK